MILAPLRCTGQTVPEPKQREAVELPYWAPYAQLQKQPQVAIAVIQASPAREDLQSARRSVRLLPRRTEWTSPPLIIVWRPISSKDLLLPQQRSQSRRG